VFDDASAGKNVSHDNRKGRKGVDLTFGKIVYRSLLLVDFQLVTLPEASVSSIMTAWLCALVQKHLTLFAGQH